MRRRIRTSMIGMLLVVGILLGAPLSVIAWWWTADNAHQDLDLRLKHIASELIQMEGPGGELDSVAITEERFGMLIPEGGVLRVTHHVPSRAGVGGTPTVVTTKLGPPIGGREFTDSINLGEAGAVELAVPLGQVRRDQWLGVMIVAVVVLGSVGGGVAVATVTARRLADPLTRVADRATAMARGDFRSEWPEYGIPELDRVSRALGAANTEIATRLDREAGIVGEVSHQLRSRMTAIQLRLDELAMYPDENVVAEAEAAAGQVERLTRDLDQMVVASRVSQGAPAKAVRVDTMVRTLVADFAPAFIASDRQLRIVTQGGMPAMAWTAQPSRLREAVAVLVDNALHHGRGTATVVLDTLPATGMLRLEVTDEGDGVPDELVDKIFRRGFTGGVATGTGVGLSLARALVEADGGRLELSSRRPPVFSIVVPASAPVETVARDRAPHR
ncbi:sensor histidine kinase [Gordonia crocea]|uniref:Signal transduction histidine-protein kinase/phosphatase MprB n=1 Tax=Gordonia crocea TaxID=589162 RepID=A0A7I9UWR0_9ACTN|nr:HAMP domain-containing sensor histidine kinase [Gordonia crocea]GED97372.1 two-component sensor histidine kinase [Gordonia crocea]